VSSPYTLRRFEPAPFGFVLALLTGASTFWATLPDSFLQAFYRATVTISLTGIDTKPAHTGGVVVTIVLILAGMAIYGYLAGAIVEPIAHGVLTGTLAERRRRRVIERLRDHYIICGSGRVGRQVGHELRDARAPYVVLDFNPDALEHARPDGAPSVEGTGTSDADLAAAGLGRARGLRRGARSASCACGTGQAA